MNAAAPAKSVRTDQGPYVAAQVVASALGEFRCHVVGGFDLRRVDVMPFTNKVTTDIYSTPSNKVKSDRGQLAPSTTIIDTTNTENKIQFN